MSDLNIRLAASGDFLPVATLLAELDRPAMTPETADTVQAVYEKHITDPETASLVAELDRTIVGFLSLVFRDHLNYPRSQGWIPDLIVTEAARGKGVARALLERAFAEAQSRGCDWVRLESGYARKAAHQVYEVVGMVNGGFYFTKRLAE